MKKLRRTPLVILLPLLGFCSVVFGPWIRKAYLFDCCPPPVDPASARGLQSFLGRDF